MTGGLFAESACAVRELRGVGWCLRSERRRKNNENGSATSVDAANGGRKLSEVQDNVKWLDSKKSGCGGGMGMRARCREQWRRVEECFRGWRQAPPEVEGGPPDLPDEPKGVRVVVYTGQEAERAR